MSAQLKSTRPSTSFYYPELFRLNDLDLDKGSFLQGLEHTLADGSRLLTELATTPTVEMLEFFKEFEKGLGKAIELIVPNLTEKQIADLLAVYLRDLGFRILPFGSSVVIDRLVPAQGLWPLRARLGQRLQLGDSYTVIMFVLWQGVPIRYFKTLHIPRDNLLLHPLARQAAMIKAKAYELFRQSYRVAEINKKLRESFFKRNAPAESQFVDGEVSLKPLSSPWQWSFSPRSAAQRGLQSLVAQALPNQVANAYWFELCIGDARYSFAESDLLLEFGGRVEWCLSRSNEMKSEHRDNQRQTSLQLSSEQSARK